MRFDSLEINTSRSAIDKMRFCFYLYFILIILEGALRKWIIPWATVVVPVFRDPIVLYVLCLGINKGLVRGPWTKFYFWTSVAAFLTTIIWGHQNIYVAIYGFRIFGFHFPAMILWSKILNRTDVQRICSLMTCLVIPMTILIVLQYLSPTTAWVNRGTAGEESTSAFTGVGEYHRPSGMFSSSAGLVRFEFLAACCILYQWFGKENIINKRILFASTIAFLVSIFTCLSRAIIVQFVFCLFIFVVFSLQKRKNLSRMFGFIIIGIGIFFVMTSTIPYFSKTIDVLTARFNSASNSEGNFIEGSLMGRIGGQYIRAFTDTQNFSGMPIPFWGFGLGGGTAVGRNLMRLTSAAGFTYAEEPWSVTICESGYFIGGILLLIGRLYFSINFSLMAIKTFLRSNDWLCLAFVPIFSITLFASQLSVPTNLGFTILSGTILLSSLKIAGNHKKRTKTIS